MSFFFLIAVVVAIVIAAAALHLGWWTYLIFIAMAILIRRMIWRHRLPPAWLTRFDVYMRQYVREPHGKLRLVLATLLAIGGWILALSGVKSFFYLVRPLWFNALASTIVVGLGIALIWWGVRLFQRRGRLRLRHLPHQGPAA